MFLQMAQGLPLNETNAGVLVLAPRPLRTGNEIRKPYHGKKGLPNAEKNTKLSSVL